MDMHSLPRTGLLGPLERRLRSRVGALTWAFPVSEYKTVDSQLPPTSFWRSFIHSLNFSDFAVDIWLSLRFYVDYYIHKKEYTRLQKDHSDQARLLGGNNLDLGAAFDVSLSTLPYSNDPAATEKGIQPAYVIHVHQDSEEALDDDLKDEAYPPNSSRWSDATAASEMERVDSKGGRKL